MSNLQEALTYIAEANFADYFAFMDKVLGKNYELSLLKAQSEQKINDVFIFFFFVGKLFSFFSCRD
jgi:hypothetical protein